MGVSIATVVVIIEVSASAPDRPPPGAPLTVQLRDTSLADGPASVVAEISTRVRGELGTWLDTVELAVDADPADCTVWAHADVDEDGRVSEEDYVTMASFPVPSGDEVRVAVEVRRV